MVEHHSKKIALWFAAMYHVAKDFKDKSINGRYIKLTDFANMHRLTSEVSRDC